MMEKKGLNDLVQDLGSKHILNFLPMRAAELCVSGSRGHAQIGHFRKRKN